MSVKAYSYLRISTDIQKAGDGVRRQLEASKAFAVSQGYELVETIQDIGVSGFRGKNSTEGAFADFLSAIDNGDVLPGSVLIVESLDRLSRDGATRAFSQFAGILSKGVKIVTLMDQQEYTEESVNSNPGQLFTSLGVMIRANEESATKSKRLKAAWDQKRSSIQSRKLTSRVPAWLSLSEDGKTFEIIERSADVVRAIFDLCVAGVGAYSITRLLNDDKNTYPPISRTNRWNKSYVMKILNNRAVLGEFQPRKIVDGRRVEAGDVVANYFPEIVTEETFLLAQRALRHRRVGSAGRKGKTFSNLFTNVAKCGTCGGSMTFRNKGLPPKGGKYLHCYNSVANNGCNRPAWNYENFQSAFFEFVKEVDFASLFEETTGQEVLSLDRQKEAALERKALLEAQTSQLYDRMVSLEITAEVFKALSMRADELNQEVQSLSEQIEALSHKISQQKSVSLQDEQKSFLREFESLVLEQEDQDVALIRAKLNGRIKRYVERITIHNGFRLEPWEVDGNLSKDYAEHLAKKGISSVQEVERFLDSASGQRDFDAHQRYFVVRFVNGTTKYVQPSQSRQKYWITDRLAQLISD